MKRFFWFLNGVLALVLLGLLSRPAYERVAGARRMLQKEKACAASIARTRGWLLLTQPFLAEWPEGWRRDSEALVVRSYDGNRSSMSICTGVKFLLLVEPENAVIQADYTVAMSDDGEPLRIERLRASVVHATLTNLNAEARLMHERVRAEVGSNRVPAIAAGYAGVHLNATNLAECVAEVNRSGQLPESIRAALREKPVMITLMATGDDEIHKLLSAPRPATAPKP